eukprot:503771_1
MVYLYQSNICIRVISVGIVVLSILVYTIHNAAPYLRLECVALSVSCPITKSYGTINDHKSADSIHLKPLKQIMQQWIRDGYSTGSQLSIFTNDKERLNIFAKDDRKYPNFDRNSLVPVFSTTHNFASLLMGIAVQNEWIQSLDDAVTDYWPQFPTQRLVLPYDTWLAYYDAHSSTVNHNTLAQYCNQHRIHLDIRPYRVKIKDVLRHEAGYGLLLSDVKMTPSTTTYQDIKTMIERTEYLIQFEDATRSYHGITRGFILNQIFMNMEPKRRSMSEYYQQEIVTKLASQDTNADEEFLLLFEGLKNTQKYVNKMYPVVQPPMYWNLYHVALPTYLRLILFLNEKRFKMIWHRFSRFYI